MGGLVASLRLDASSRRDVRIDWLRGLAMTCVIVNHSRLSSPISWFTYERFWVVTAAEVFVVLSGVVLGMVYRKRLARDGWLAVARALGRRAALLYGAFVAVAVSVIALGMIGVDVSALAASDGRTPAWFAAPQTMDVAAWRDVLLMRAAPWAFEIIGLYVWLVAAAVPCLFILHRVGWRALLAVSWALYLWYRIDPRTLTLAGFEASFLAAAVRARTGVRVSPRSGDRIPVEPAARGATSGGDRCGGVCALRVLQSLGGRAGMAAPRPRAARSVL